MAPNITNKRYVFIVHSFAYPKNILNLIQNLEKKNIIVIFTGENKIVLKSLISKLKKKKLKVLFYKTQNYGRDVIPFILAFRKFAKSGDIIIKYHHKLSNHFKNRGFVKIWNDQNYIQIKQCLKNINKFDLSKKIFCCQFYGVNSFLKYKKVNYWLLNVILTILKNIFYKTEFAVSNNFITSFDYIDPIINKFDYKNEDLTEPIDYDGTILHKFERLLKKNILCYKDLGSLFRIKIIYLQIFAFIKNKIL